MPDGSRPDDLAAARKLIDAGRLTEASSLLLELLEHSPAHPDAWFLMGQVARAAGKIQMAAKMVEAALARRSNSPEFLREHATILLDLGQKDQAAACHLRILELDPDNFDSNEALGRHYSANGQLNEAYRYLRSAARLRPNQAEIYNLLGQVLLDAGVLDEARNAFLACLEMAPGHVQALLRLGNLHRERNQTGQAIEFYQRALATKPDDPFILSNLGNAWLDLGETTEAIACYEKSLARYADAPTTHGNLIFALNYQPGLTPSEVAEAHRSWGRRFAAGLPRVEFPAVSDASGNRPLRIGFVSADFRQHPVGCLAELIFRHLNAVEFELFVYDNGLRSDARTTTLQSLAPNWRKIARIDDESAIRLIREDGVDILVDLSGHTSGGRLLLFARHPAPVQIALFAYPNTTGLDAMDYRITDPFADPPGRTEHLHTERLIRLNRTAWVYAPPKSSPEPGPPPCLSSPSFVFGCLNNPAKISRSAVTLWTRVLEQVPWARLMLLTREEAEHTVLLRRRFSEAGANLEQLWLVPRASQAIYLEYHRSVDLMFDPFPYNGGVTTCDALWMGVPVLTLAGEAYVSRQGVSVLGNVGLCDCIAETPDEFVTKAVAWARAPERAAELRRGLRQKMRQSPLLDYATYAAELGQVFRNLWRKSQSAV